MERHAKVFLENDHFNSYTVLFNMTRTVGETRNIYLDSPESTLSFGLIKHHENLVYSLQLASF